MTNWLAQSESAWVDSTSEPDPKVKGGLLSVNYNFLLNVHHGAENRLRLGPTAWALAASIRGVTQVTDIKLDTFGSGSQ